MSDEQQSQPPEATPASSSSASTSPGGFVPPTIEELDVALSNYEFIEILGAGGMGAVYKARQPNLDRLVAIKILPAELGDEGMQFAERFKREAQALAKLNHPNIVAVYDFGQTTDNQLYFVMEFVEGTDLHQVIRSKQATTEHVLGWIPQVCNALQYAHSKGIVHRDIKPANILIDLQGNVKVADFGLAKLTGDDGGQSQLTMTNMAMGTPDYVAPETLELGIEPDYRADVYAIGVMLYEMLTGSVPRGAFKMPSQRVPGLDPRYDDLVSEAMDSDRDTRIQQAGEISTRLEKIRTEPTPSSAANLVAGGARKVQLVTGPVQTQQSPPSGATGPVSEAAISGPRSTGQTQISSEEQKRGPMPMVIGGLLAILLLGGLLFFFLRDSNDEPIQISEMLAGEQPVPLSASPSPVRLEPELPVPDPVVKPPEVTAEEPVAAPLTSLPSPVESTAEEAPDKGDTVVDAPAALVPESAMPETKEPSAPQTEASKKLAELFAKYETGYQNTMLAEHEKVVGKLDASYLGALGRERNRAADSGDLDSVVVFRTEANRVKEGGALPAGDEGLPAALVRLRTTYRQQIGSLTEDLGKRAAGLVAPLDRLMATLEVDFTKEGKVEDALEVREARAKLKIEGLPFLVLESAEPAPMQTATPTAATKTAAAPPEGAIRVSPAGGDGSLTLLDALAQAKSGQTLVLAEGEYPDGPVMNTDGTPNNYYEIGVSGLTLIGERASLGRIVVTADRVEIRGVRVGRLVIGAMGYLQVNKGGSVNSVVVDSCVLGEVALLGMDTSATIVNSIGTYGGGDSNTRTAVNDLSFINCTMIARGAAQAGMQPPRMGKTTASARNCIFFGQEFVFRGGSTDMALIRFTDSFIWAGKAVIADHADNTSLRRNGYLGIDEQIMIDPGFEDPSDFPAGFRLKADSPLRGKAKDGGDPGARLDEDGWPIFDIEE